VDQLPLFPSNRDENQPNAPENCWLALSDDFSQGQAVSFRGSDLVGVKFICTTWSFYPGKKIKNTGDFKDFNFKKSSM